MSKVRTQAIIAVIIGNVIFGFSFLFSKLAMDVTLPAVLIASRFTVAFVVLNLIVLIGGRIKKKDGNPLIAFSLKNKPKKDIILLALFQPIIYFIGESYGILYTSTAFAGVIIAVIPIAGIIFDILFFHSKVHLRQVLCSVGSVVGVIITTLGASSMTSSLKGILFLLLAVVAGALFYVYSKKAGEHYNPLERTYVMFGMGSMVYIVIALIQCRGAYEKWILGAVTDPMFLIGVGYLAVVSSVVAFLLLNFGSSRISVSQASMFANLTTVISIIAGVVILQEHFSWQQVVGAVIIVVSVYLAGK